MIDPVPLGIPVPLPTERTVAVVVPAHPGRRVVTVWSDITSPNAAHALATLHSRAKVRGVALLIDHRCSPGDTTGGHPAPAGPAELAAINALYPGHGWQPRAEACSPAAALLPMEAVQAAKHLDPGGLAAGDELDAALRHALLVEGCCIGRRSVITEVARRCRHVDDTALLDALAAGDARLRVLGQWATAERRATGGLCFLTASGYTERDPGIAVRGPTGTGLARVTDTGPAWADRIIDALGP